MREMTVKFVYAYKLPLSSDRLKPITSIAPLLVYKYHTLHTHAQSTDNTSLFLNAPCNDILINFKYLLLRRRQWKQQVLYLRSMQCHKNSWPHIKMRRWMKYGLKMFANKWKYTCLHSTGKMWIFQQLWKYILMTI